MQNEPKPEAIAEDFVQFFQNTVAELEGEAATATEPVAPSEPDNPPAAETPEATETSPSLDLEQIIALALGRMPEETAEPASETNETSEAPTGESEPPAESPRETPAKRTKPEPEATEPDEESGEDDDDEEGDWLSQLFRPREKTSRTTDDSEPDETETSPVSEKSNKKPKSELEAKLAELEQRVKTAEEVAQQVVMATTLRLWVEQAKQESQAFQNVVRQHGIELSDQDVEDAMVRALSQLQHNPNALHQELAAKALQAMAKEYSKAMRLPAQFQPAQPRNQPNELRTFEDYLELAMREINDRR